ncbi:MAG: serine protease spb1 [Bdellovibrionales bacterium]
MKSKIKSSSHLIFKFYWIISWLLVQFLFIATPQKSFAASCCGGGFAAPSLIVGDDQAQITNSISYNHIIDDVGTDSLWHKRKSNEINATIKIEAAHILSGKYLSNRFLSDRWQLGFSLPIISRSRADQTSSGLGDVAGTIGYEYLPDWDYNPWRPRGLGFLILTLPTGRSVNESETAYQLDSRGRGFLALGAGTILTKIINKWDVFSSIEVHNSFKKKYSNSQSSGTLNPGFGTNFGFGVGYNLDVVRLGSGISWSYEDAVDVTGTSSSSGSAQRFATASISASYLFEHEWATTINYTDQTIVGSPTNTSLSRGVNILVQKRWLR